MNAAVSYARAGDGTGGGAFSPPGSRRVPIKDESDDYINGASHNATSASGAAVPISASPSDLLDMYSEPPSAELDIDEFEELALARLRVLRRIEELRTRNVTGDAFRASLEKTLKAHLGASAPVVACAAAAGRSGSSSADVVRSPRGKVSARMSSGPESQRFRTSEAMRRADVSSHFIR